MVQTDHRGTVSEKHDADDVNAQLKQVEEWRQVACSGNSLEQGNRWWWPACGSVVAERLEHKIEWFRLSWAQAEHGLTKAHGSKVTERESYYCEYRRHNLAMNARNPFASSDTHRWLCLKKRPQVSHLNFYFQSPTGLKLWSPEGRMCGLPLHSDFHPWLRSC